MANDGGPPRGYGLDDEPSQVRGMLGRVPTTAGGVPITGAVDVSQAKLTIPVLLLLGLLGTVVGGIWTFSLAFNRLDNHVRDSHIHVDSSSAIHGGGVAFKNDLRDERQRMRSLLKSMVIECRREGGPRSETFSCRVDLPEGP